MSRFSCILPLILVFMDSCYGEFVDANHFRQEGARFTYIDHRYFKDVSVFTSHPSRNSPYLTTIHMTSLVPVGNNVTVHVQAYSTKTEFSLINLELKVCDWWKQIWVQDFLVNQANITSCPIPPGTYHVNGIELPPKNCPIPLQKSDYKIKTTCYLTKSKEIISEGFIELKYMRPKKN